MTAVFFILEFWFSRFSGRFSRFFPGKLQIKIFITSRYIRIRSDCRFNPSSFNECSFFPFLTCLSQISGRFSQLFRASYKSKLSSRQDTNEFFSTAGLSHPDSVNAAIFLLEFMFSRFSRRFSKFFRASYVSQFSSRRDTYESVLTASLHL